MDTTAIGIAQTVVMFLTGSAAACFGYMLYRVTKRTNALQDRFQNWTEKQRAPDATLFGVGFFPVRPVFEVSPLFFNPGNNPIRLARVEATLYCPDEKPFTGSRVFPFPMEMESEDPEKHIAYLPPGRIRRVNVKVDMRGLEHRGQDLNQVSVKAWYASGGELRNREWKRLKIARTEEGALYVKWPEIEGGG